MYRPIPKDNTQPELVPTSTNSQSRLYHHRGEYSPQAQAHSSLTYALPKSSRSAYRDGPLDVLVQPEGMELDIYNPESGRPPPRPIPRPSQNRAPFGKWKSKMIAGFPSVDEALPPGITAKEICESFPNHVTDYTILALMREGKGAKAIDALIPAPPGKKKAGQSHSKIQLRISTIRDAFPNENFPITSARRIRGPITPSKDGGSGSGDEGVRIERANDFGGSDGSVVRIPGARSRRNGSSEVIQPLNTHDLTGDGQSNEDVKIGVSDLPTSDLCYLNPIEKADLPLYSGSMGEVASAAPVFPQMASHLRQRPSLEMLVKREYHRHQQLVFHLYYKAQPLSPLEMEQTVQAHCAEMYDRYSGELQSKSGVIFAKAISPTGWPEHSLSYLKRSIAQSFPRLPHFPARIDFDSPSGQMGTRVEMVVLQNLLARMHGWTKYLEKKLEMERRTMSHRSLHAMPISRHNNSDPNQHEAIFRSQNSHAEHNANTGRADKPLHDPSRTHLESEVHETTKADSLADFDTWYPIEIFDPSGGEDMNLEAWSAVPPNTLSSDNRGVSDTVSTLVSGLPSPSSNNLHLDERFLLQESQQCERVDGSCSLGRSLPGSVSVDHVMMDATETRQAIPRHDFEAYMKEVGQVSTLEAEAADIPQLFDHFAERGKTSRPMKELDADALATMDDDAFILFGWESLTHHKFGQKAETMLEQDLDILYELGEDERQEHLWGPLQEAGDKQGEGRSAA